MTPPHVAIAIIVYNSAAEAFTCIDSCLASDYSAFSVTVLDNGSTDDTAHQLNERYAADGRVHVITKSPNAGFSGGFNRAAEIALAQSPKYVWILADDMRLAPDAMSILVAAMEKDDRIGVAGQLMYHADSPTRIYYAGGRLEFHSDFGGMVAASHDYQDEHDDGTIAARGTVATDFVTGASMFFRAAALSQVGGMDSAYWLYWEDVDLSWRTHLSGWKVVVVSEARSWHDVTAPGDDSLRIRARYDARNRLEFTSRYQRGWTRLLALKFLWRTAREQGFRSLGRSLPVVLGTYDFLLGRKGRLPENW